MHKFEPLTELSLSRTQTHAQTLCLPAVLRKITTALPGKITERFQIRIKCSKTPNSGSCPQCFFEKGVQKHWRFCLYFCLTNILPPFLSDKCAELLQALPIPVVWSLGRWIRGNNFKLRTQMHTSIQTDMSVWPPLFLRLLHPIFNVLLLRRSRMTLVGIQIKCNGPPILICV